MKNLQELLEHEIKDLYSAEKQLSEAMPKMVETATDKKLKKAFENHLEETKGQIERLEKVCDHLGIKPGGKKCDAMEGLIKEAKGVIKEDATEAVKDAALIAAAQRIEHYEISGYGTARQYAETLGHKEVEKLLNQTLEQEANCNEHLNDLAINGINKKAK